MKGDFTRDTFNPRKNFTRVLRQQGRVTLDADSNEQTAILLHYLRTLTTDLIGPYAAPFDDAGFALTDERRSHHHRRPLHVGGILVENHDDCLYAHSHTGRSRPTTVVEDAKDQTGKVYWLPRRLGAACHRDRGR